MGTKLQNRSMCSYQYTCKSLILMMQYISKKNFFLLLLLLLSQFSLNQKMRLLHQGRLVQVSKIIHIVYLVYTRQIATDGSICYLLKMCKKNTQMLPGGPSHLQNRLEIGKQCNKRNLKKCIIKTQMLLILFFKDSFRKYINE